ncbi:phage terminase large subunit [Citrobacter sp. Cb220]|nr:phage terminase large subunit [Citrobacter sp. Cb220]MDM3316392.1 phage terminase large subunit [Citrobacter sp. Cb220]
MSSSPQLSAVSKQAAARELLKRRSARASLHDFIQYINPEYITSKFSQTVCDALDQFLLDMMNGLRPILILGAPPQHGKSDIVSRYLPAYFFGKYPEMRVGALSYSADLAGDMNADVQRIMSTPEYRNIFPGVWLGNKPADGVAVKRNTDEFGIANHKGTYVCAGVGGPLTGKKIDLGIIDDPIKNAKEALSPTTKKSIWNWYVSTFKTRLSKNSGEIIMATRWATDDLSGRVVEITPRAKVLAFPAINEQGEALVPELHPKEKLLETKTILGDYFWSAMYQQSPKQAGGSIFKDEWIKYYLPKDLPTNFDIVIHSWDMTFKDSEGTDYVVGQVWGKKGANAYLLHQVRARMSFTATLKAVKRMADEFPKGLRKLVEDKANGPAVIDSLKNTVAGLVPVEPDGSKVARAHAITAVWEAGNVFLPHKDIAPWIIETVEEITTFSQAFGIDLTGMLGDGAIKPEMEKAVNDNVDLITSIHTDFIHDIGAAVFENMKDGGRHENLIDLIKERGEVTRNRARFIARDQTSKLNADLTEARNVALGLDLYEWGGTGDERERENHFVLNSMLCKYSDPTVYSDDGGKTWKKRSTIGAFIGKPGEDYQCRCLALPYVSWD